MPSPDITPYVDLTLFDKDPQDLVDQAVEDALVTLPDWEPAEGNTEMVVLEGEALIGAEVIYAINRLPGATVEILLALYGVLRDAGSPPTVELRFELSDDLGHTIDAGTTVRLPLGGDLEVMDFTTDADLVVANGDTEGVVMATGSRNSIDANGIAAETEYELQDAVPYVDRVMGNTDVNAGAEPETGEDFLDRGVQVLRRLVNTLVLPEHFTAEALLNPLVVRATTLDNFDVTVGGGSVPGDHPGHVTVLVAGAAGAALDPGDVADLDADLEAKSMANLAVHVAGPTVTNVAVTAEVIRLAGYLDAEVEANVGAALQAYLDPDTWEWGRDVYRNELISVIDQVEGVDRVVSVTAPAADVVVDVDELINDGVLTITVTAP